MIKLRFSCQELETILYRCSENFGATDFRAIKLTLVRPQEPEKLDLSNDYPCPCWRWGRFFLTILTEVLGYDWDQQIFVVKENRQMIEQLSSSFPYKRSWLWTGCCYWLGVRPSLEKVVCE